MRKSVLKRIKFTGTGKMLRRHPGQNHFNAKTSRRAQLRNKGDEQLSPILSKKFKAHLL